MEAKKEVKDFIKLLKNRTIDFINLLKNKIIEANSQAITIQDNKLIYSYVG
jgi:hypothetical protein